MRVLRVARMEWCSDTTGGDARTTLWERDSYRGAGVPARPRKAGQWVILGSPTSECRPRTVDRGPVGVRTAHGRPPFASLFRRPSKRKGFRDDGRGGAAEIVRPAGPHGRPSQAGEDPIQERLDARAD